MLASAEKIMKGRKKDLKWPPNGYPQQQKRRGFSASHKYSTSGRAKCPSLRQLLVSPNSRAGPKTYYNSICAYYINMSKYEKGIRDFATG